MWRLALAIILAAFSCAAQITPSQDSAPSRTAPTSTIAIPAGTKVELAITSPIWARSAGPGASIYAEVVFPLALNGQMVIPAGTQVQGEIDSVKNPGVFSPHAQIQAHFTNLVFANGYAVALFGPEAQTSLAPPPLADDVIPVVASVYVDVSARSDVLLDDGDQIEMLFQDSFALDGDKVRGAIRKSARFVPPASKSSTLCRPTPGTPGTPDTVIPGTPGTPGTPDTVIPGVNGAPDTVIPGIPATPGTPDTVIPGTSGFPGTACPGPPVVATNAKLQKYSENFELTAVTQVGGTQLMPGTYEAVWEGEGPAANVEILQKKKVVARTTAHVFVLAGSPTATSPEIRPDSGGAALLQWLRFKDQPLALYFDTGAS